jgi:tRNA-Thr(GGU) m(6)t(6)A37 methyltransferase TsaA
MRDRYTVKPIGVIRTPYVDSAPYQPVDEDEGDFRIVVDPEYADGLADLERFSYVYVLYYIDRLTRAVSTRVKPSWAPSVEVGVFASRSPLRPNPLGLSVVRVRSIEGNEVLTSGLDVFDNTPLLDIKPYVKDLDTKDDANYGWIDDLGSDKGHLLLHIKGIPHEY